MESNFRKNCIERLEGGYVYDREVLALLLKNAFTSLDADALAGELLYTFPSTAAVLKADFAALTAVRGMTRQVAEYIVALGKVEGFSIQPLTHIESSEQLIEYGINKCRGSDCEQSELYCVNRNGKVVAHRVYQSDYMKKVELNISNLAAYVAASGASGFYLLHNHVYGAILPSEQDDIFTAKLLSIFAHGGIKFIDHCIVGAREGYSYLKSGRLQLLTERLK